jgi:hypothetical protein
MFLHSRGTGYGDNVGARAKRCLSKIAHLVGPVVGQNALPEMTRLILKRHALKRLFDHLVGAQEERLRDREGRATPLKWPQYSISIVLMLFARQTQSGSGRISVLVFSRPIWRDLDRHRQ